MGMSLAEYRELKKAKEKKRQKYNAVPTVVDGIRFDSKAEARFYEELKLLRHAGEISYFLMQTPVHLPGNGKLEVDFMIVHSNGRIQYVDVKGKATKEWLAKRRVAEAIYPFKIETRKMKHANRKKR
jgi:hypothetical protein